MYKVFYKERTIFFTDRIENVVSNKNTETHQFKNKKHLQKALRLFENNPDISQFYIINTSTQKAFRKFKKLHKIIEAAGGLVFSSKNELLFIYRRNKWDLPKGKLERFESPENAAIREVEEECGIHNLIIQKHLVDTYHIYQLKNKSVLKKTYWYEMKYEGTEKLIPQTEEDITDSVWFKKENLNQVLSNTFLSIIEVLDKAGILSSKQ